MKQTLIITLILLTSQLTGWAADKKYQLESPNGHIVVEVTAGSELTYQISANNQVILSNSKIDLVLPEGKSAGKDVRVNGAQRKKIAETIEAPFYRFKEFTTACN